MKSFVSKTIGVALLAIAGLAFSPATASAQTTTTTSATATSTRELPPQAVVDLRNALNLLSITLGTLEVRMEQQQAVLVGANQQLGVVASQLTALQNPAVLDTERERNIVSQIISLDTQLVGVIKSQVDLVKQDQSRQITAVSGLTSAFKSLTEAIVKWRTSA